MHIDKDTLLFGSFSENPGNNGCEYFNTRFQNEGVNAIYKSFKVFNIKDAFQAAFILDMKGFAISAPFKTQAFQLIDRFIFDEVEIGAVNTVINKELDTTGYNTDWIGVKSYLTDNQVKPKGLNIIGNGGFSKAVQYACKDLDINFNIIGRDLDFQEDYIIFNATPSEITHEYIPVIDARPFTTEGKKISRLIAAEQYKLYEQFF